MKNKKQQILEGSRAIALTIKNIKPQVVSAYPITPQTHIVEDLAKFKADGETNYEYVRAESEFAAASIVEGASATGARVYSATSSQGLLLMTEVIFNIAGMRLPVVLTCANRAVSGPISIWNDQQDAVTIRDAGWIMLYAENHQEAVDQHIMAYKIAEQLKLPVMINIDGFVLTHSYEPVIIPTPQEIKKYLPDYKPAKDEFLNTANPLTFGAFATPAHYMEIRQELHNDLMASLNIINKEYSKYKNYFSHTKTKKEKLQIKDSGLIEYYGPKKPKTIIVAMGSVIGTIKNVIDNLSPRSPLLTRRGAGGEVGVLKIKCFRPFPAKEIIEILKMSKFIAVIDKSISLGNTGTLANEIKAAAQGNIKSNIKSFIVGLGGRDITGGMIRKIIAEAGKKKGDGTMFVGR